MMFFIKASSISLYLSYSDWYLIQYL